MTNNTHIPADLDNALRSVFSENEFSHGSQLRVLAACLLARETGQAYFDLGSKRVAMTIPDLTAFMDKLATDRRLQVDVYTHLQTTKRSETLLTEWRQRAGQ